MTVEEYLGDWIRIIDKKELYSIMNKVSVLYKTKSLCPKQSDVFKAFRVCPYNDLKIVMLFQDPYPQRIGDECIATGIALGNSETTENNISPSLNIVKEAVINFDIPHNCITFDPTLESWCKQGILMLNTALTVETNKIGSHTMLWRPFISKLIQNICLYNTGLIYVLFGKQAQTFEPYINKRFNHIIKSNHPSYYARTETRMSNEIFKEIDKLLYEKYGNTIKWYEEFN